MLQLNKCVFLTQKLNKLNLLINNRHHKKSSEYTLIIFNKPAPAPVTIATRPSNRRLSMLYLDTSKIKITFIIYSLLCRHKQLTQVNMIFYIYKNKYSINKTFENQTSCYTTQTQI